MEIYVVFIVSFFLVWIAEKTNKKNGMVLAIILLSAFVGFRDMSIGRDTGIYHQFLVNLQRGSYSSNVEYGFLLFSNVLLKIFGSIPMVFFFYSLITNACVLIRLWTLKRVAPFSRMCLVYLILVYPQTCSILRQTMVVAVIFLATILIERKKYVAFLSVVVICYCVHRTSILGVLLLPLYIIFSNNVEKRIKRNLIAISIIAVPILLYLCIRVFRIYEYYFASSNNEFGFMNPAKLIAWGLCSFVFCKELFLKNEKSACTINFYQENRFIMMCYVIGIMFAFLGYYRTTLTRISMVFSIFEIVYIPLVCYQSRQGKTMAKLMYFVILSYFVYVGIRGGWSGLGNYISVFANN